MATPTMVEAYDLLILVDATYSMFNYLEALKTSLPKVIALSNLTGSFTRIGLLAYRDYSEGPRNKDGMLEWSGWYDQDNPDIDGNVGANILQSLATHLEPIGGGDYPEATKTGLARAYSLMRADAKTIILLYTDAPPHCYMVADRDRGSNYHAEQAALSVKTSYGGYGPCFVDWVSACKQLHSGPKIAHVLCFLDENLGTRPEHAGYYTYLSTVTRGACFYMIKSDPHSIAEFTVDVLLAWMGTEKAGARKVSMPANLIRYKTGDNIKQIKNEKDVVANLYFWAHNPAPESLRLLRAAEDAKGKQQLHNNVAETRVGDDILKKYLIKRKVPIGDLAKRYTNDERYKSVVASQLKHIIESDVTSVSLNPVFGSLWRSVCNDRANPARESLIDAFSMHVDRIADVEEKAHMKNWLEESYDYAADILELLDHVPTGERFPCVFLDPTIDFREAAKNAGDEDNRPVNQFRRDELLEIGRSCDGRVLRRLGRILTCITFAESEADLPAHIARTSNAEVPKIPLALASKNQDRKFWKILLHVVLPGTMLGARPATVLAALAIRIGLQPLFKTASAALMFWRDKWNNLEVPETWNASCLSLLLDADAEYRKQLEFDDDNGLLLSKDKELFSSLVRYHHTGKNLLTTLVVKVGWTPEKTQIPIGPIAICRGCKMPRSVTIMAEKCGGLCGLCLKFEDAEKELKQRKLSTNVTKEDTEQTKAAWLECSVRTCRAQYVCYNVQDLQARAKCYFCRQQTLLPETQRNKDPAPTLECTLCLNKMIWPSEYRATVVRPFVCVPCQSGHATVVGVDTNAAELSLENGSRWLIRNDNDVIAKPFHRSVFHIISTVGVQNFMEKVEVLPAINPGPFLTYYGKQIQNQEEMLNDLKAWIQRRTAETTQCSLCFDDFRKAELLPACRRHGCHQLICRGCLDGWYGANRPGTIINTATLFCPFCRRPPVARTIAAYGKGIHAVGGLATALKERGSWIHAWCRDCGKAKRYVPRECARGAPQAVEKWLCEICTESDLERARMVEEELRLALEDAQKLRSRDRQVLRSRWQAAARLVHDLSNPPKNCPGCKTPTIKTWGCDHMHCIVPQCDTHWCWSCGGRFDASTIYNHMSLEHDGMY